MPNDEMDLNLQLGPQFVLQVTQETFTMDATITKTFELTVGTKSSSLFAGGGERGPQGEIGPQGERGLQGFPGADSTVQGPQGIQGPIGSTGPRGFQGERGLIGPEGPQGPQGDIGPIGETGPRGNQGPQGIKGDQGLVGPQGPTGQQGAASTVAGPTGPTGPKGNTGSSGPKGDDGADGPKGDRGFTGTEGAKGDQGIPGLTGPKGIQGDQGLIGPAGPKGDTGLKGDKGDTGPIGPSGGEQGIQGPAGPAGADGTNGVDGAAGPQGIQGPVGPKGDTGDTGPAGADGVGGGSSTFAELTDTPAGPYSAYFGKTISFAEDGSVIIVDRLSGPTNFVGLDDTPTNYFGSAGMFLASTGAGLEFVAAPEGGTTAPVTEPVKSTHWRVKFTGAINANFISIREMEFNSAQATGGTPIYSSQYDATTYDAGKAFDGNKASGAWATVQGGKANAYLGYIFSNTKAVTSVQLTGSDDPQQSPSGIIIQMSDDSGASWNDIITYPDLVWIAGEEKSFSVPEETVAVGPALNPNAGYSYWRLFVTANNGDTSYTSIKVAFFDLDGVNVSADIPAGDISAINGSLSSGFTKEKAFTAWTSDSTDYFSSGDASMPVAVGFYSATPVAIGYMTMTGIRLSARVPKDFEIQCSKDGVIWHTASTVTNQTGWALANADTRQFNLPEVPNLYLEDVGRQYTLATFVAGTFAADEVVQYHAVVNSIELKNFGSISGLAKNPSTATYDVSIQKNDVEFAIMSFESNVKPSIRKFVPVTLSVGDVLSIVGAGIQNTALTDISITIKGAIL